MKEKKFDVNGMSCAACQANVTKAAQKLDGVQKVDVSLLTGKMKVSFDESAVSEQDICSAVSAIGYPTEPAGKKEEGKSGFKAEWEKRQKRADKSQKQMARRLKSSILILIPLMYLSMGYMHHWPMPSFLSEEPRVFTFTLLWMNTIVVIINRKFFTNGFKGLVRRATNMDTLVALGSGASFLYSLVLFYRMLFLSTGVETLKALSGNLYFEASAMILTLVTVGKYLESRSKAHTSDALGKLVDIAPKTARVLRNNKETTIAQEAVVAGDIVIIRPGETIPVDGSVIEGNGYVDQSPLTGESIPVEKQKGDKVLSATTNLNGSFRFTAEQVGENTAFSKIIRLVDEAGNSKAPIARVADKVAGIFVPVVLGIALATFIGWIIAGYPVPFALNCAISVLLISCPCAMGLATPVAIMVGTGKAAEEGILIKSAVTLESMQGVDTVVFDKTGTITKGETEVKSIIACSEDEKTLLSSAAALEAKSEHPLGAAIVKEAEKQKLELPEVTGFLMTPGKGIQGTIGNTLWVAGNRKQMDSLNIDISDALAEAGKLAEEGKTPLFFAKGKKLAGIIAVADTLRPESKKAIEKLKEMNISTIMLTGDNKATAEAIAKETGIDEVISDLLPDGKEKEIERLQKEGRKIAMIGDGINDAPSLVRADVGIAIGAGTDVAIESADVVLLKDSLTGVNDALYLSRRVIRNIKQNLFWAFFYNALGIPVACGLLYKSFGLLLNPMIGSLCMSISSIFVVTNALRLRRVKGTETETETENQIQIQKPKEKKMKEYKLDVEGMMCPHCVAHVKTALENVDGVESVQVSLENKNAIAKSEKDLDVETLKKAVTDAGYEVK